MFEYNTIEEAVEALRKGEIIRKVPVSQLLLALREELDHWNG